MQRPKTVKDSFNFFNLDAGLTEQTSSPPDTDPGSEGEGSALDGELSLNDGLHDFAANAPLKEHVLHDQDAGKPLARVCTGWAGA